MQNRIHIVGSSPRTGTTLMAELIVSGFEIDGHSDHEVTVYERPARNHSVYCSKKPGDLMSVGPLLRIDRHLWVVHMTRDPRDVVVSRHASSPDKYWSNLGIFKSRRPTARKLDDHPRFLTIRYEDLVGEPDTVQQRLAEFMPFLTTKSPFSNYHKTAHPSDKSSRALGGVRPISTASVGAWREHKPRLAAQIEIHGSIVQDLMDLGYETDATWMAELDGVIPDNGKSRWPEHPARPASLMGTVRSARDISRYAVSLLRDMVQPRGNPRR